MYFKRIPTIYYPFNIGGQEVLKPVKDITFNVRLRKAILENVMLYDEYDIMDGETPEIIADRVYGASEYHWVIMLCNQQFSYVDDWPRPERTLFEYTQEKYEDPYAVHHYENENQFVVNSDTPGAYPVSNFEYEQRVNEQKRRIKLITPQLLGQLINEYKIV